MAERKLINKYIPKDFDPTSMPKGPIGGKVPDKSRIMLPFTCQCLSCGVILSAAKKFNARKEDTGKNYLKIKIFRFYFRCSNCGNEITFLTDPENRGYTLETGAQRLIDQYLLTQQVRQAAKNEKNNPTFISNIESIERRALLTREQTLERELLEEQYHQLRHGINYNNPTLLENLHLHEKTQLQLDEQDEQEFHSLRNKQSLQNQPVMPTTTRSPPTTTATTTTTTTTTSPPTPTITASATVIPVDDLSYLDTIFVSSDEESDHQTDDDSSVCPHIQNLITTKSKSSTMLLQKINNNPFSQPTTSQSFGLIKKRQLTFPCEDSDNPTEQNETSQISADNNNNNTSADLAKKARATIFPHGASTSPVVQLANIAPVVSNFLPTSCLDDYSDDE